MQPRPLATASAAFRRCLLFKGGKVAEQIVGYVPKETIDKSVAKVWRSAGCRVRLLISG